VRRRGEESGWERWGMGGGGGGERERERETHRQADKL
jgi:hypothetical protein